MANISWAFDLSQQHSEYRGAQSTAQQRPPIGATPLQDGSMPFDTSLGASSAYRHSESTHHDDASLSHIFDTIRTAALPPAKAPLLTGSAGLADQDDDDMLPMMAPVDRPPSNVIQDVSPPQLKQSASPPLEPENGSNLYVAGLPSTVDDDTLRSTYAPFGNVISAKVMLSVETSRSRGFGFVLFEKSAHAEFARASLHGKAVPGHGGRMQVSVSKHKGENLAVDSRVVYLRNVPVSVSAEQVADYGATFGARPKVSLRAAKADATASSQLRAFVVEFATVEAAKACVAVTHGKTPFAECAAPVLAKLEEPQALREKRLQNKPTSSQSPTNNRVTPPATTSQTSASSPGGDHISCVTTPTITIGNRTIVMQSAAATPVPPPANYSPVYTSWTPTPGAIPAPPSFAMLPPQHPQPQHPQQLAQVIPQQALSHPASHSPHPNQHHYGPTPGMPAAAVVFPAAGTNGAPQPQPQPQQPSVSYFVLPSSDATASPYQQHPMYLQTAHHQQHHHQQHPQAVAPSGMLPSQLPHQQQHLQFMVPPPQHNSFPNPPSQQLQPQLHHHHQHIAYQPQQQQQLAPPPGMGTNSGYALPQGAPPAMLQHQPPTNYATMAGSAPHHQLNVGSPFNPILPSLPPGMYVSSQGPM